MPRLAPSFSAVLCALLLGVALTTQAATPSALDKLVALCAERLLLADQVAASKAQTGKAVEDAAREAEQLTLLSAHAQTHHLAPEQVASFFRWQMEANKLIQYQLLATPLSSDGAPPISLEEIRTRLNLLNQELLQTLAPALAELQQGACNERLYRAIDAQAAQQKLDALHRTALIRAFGDTCRGL